MVNLLSNSVKFSKEYPFKAEVVLSARPFPDTDNNNNNNNNNTNADQKYVKVLVSVKDNGIGISGPAQANLFNPFNQADRSVTRKYGGSGLGK